MCMKVLITGGAGFLGSHVLQELSTENFEVFCFDDLSVGNISLVHSSSNFINGKIDHYDTVSSAVNSIKPDIVIHLAAIHHIPTCEANIGHACRVNVIGTETLLACLNKISFTGIFIFASTGGVYSPFTQELLSESSEILPIGVYTTTKVWCEEILKQESKKGEYQIINLRLFNMVGENETNQHLIPDILIQLAENKKIIDHGNLDPRRDLIHVKDVAKLIKLITTKNFTSKSNFENYNVCSGKEFSVREIIDMCKVATSKTFYLSKDKARTRKIDRISQVGSNHKAQIEFGWTPKLEIQGAVNDLWRQIRSENHYL